MFDLMFYFGLFRLKIAKTIVGKIPKNSKLIICGAWFGKKYADNSMYVYEYLLKNSDYEVYWITKDKTILKSLQSTGKPVLDWYSWKAIWKQMRAAVLFSAVQFSDFNQFWVSNSIQIDLGHGHPIKDPGEVASDKKILKLNNLNLRHINYYAVVPGKTGKVDYHHVVPIPDDHIIMSDFARNDAFIYPELRNGKNMIVDKIKNGHKAIVYMPTHRSEGKIMMNMHQLLPLDDIDKFCEKEGWVFIIKKHFYHTKEHEDFSQYKHIHDISEFNDIEPQTLLYQADILISDYSACYIDYLLLNRPLMFYHYDIVEFEKKERHLYFDFGKLNICPIAYNRDEFLTILKDICLSPTDKYSNQRNAFIPTYFANSNQKDGRAKVKAILDKLIEQYYS